jgi:protein-disulfide isomerase
MHTCLQKEETQCPLAVSATTLAMQRIKSGISQKDVLDEMGTYIETAYKRFQFDLTKTAFLGNPDAPVVIVEFADFECPFCNLAREIVASARETHGDAVVFYFKQFPLGFHKHSETAARACIAAGKQDRFWQIYNLLFDNQKQLSKEKINQLAQTLGLNMERFLKDLNDPAVAQQVRDEKAEGQKAGVDSTPTFYINGRRYLGDKTPSDFTAAVGRAVEETKADQ